MELHDQIGQSLTGLKLTVQQLKSTAPPQLFEQAQTIVSDVMDRVRQLSLNLHPHVLDDLGLKAALEWHIKNFQQRTRIKIESHLGGIPSEIGPEIQMIAFRAVQEGLNNVAKHAESARAVINLRTANDTLFLEIHDSGKGFDISQRKTELSLGLSGMRERVLLAGGTFRLESGPAEGTHIFISMPINLAKPSGPESTS